MPADSLSAGILVLSWGATYFVHSTCLIAATWLFLRTRRSAAHALRETLWKTALVGGVVTASVQMWLAPGRPFADLTVRLEGIGLPVAAAADHPITSEAAPITSLDTSNPPGLKRNEREADDRSVDESAASDSGHDFWNATGDPNVETAATSTRSNAASLAAVQSPAASVDSSENANLVGRWMTSLPAAALLSIAFAIAAIALGIVRCAWQTISLRRRLSQCRLISAGPARELLNELLRMVPRAPEVLLLSGPGDSSGPAAFGIARWTIVLPTRAAFDLSEDELRALLAHELAHLVRGDSIWLCISRVLCSCLAFQPLNHLARREWQRTAEFLCDNWAVSRTGAPLALARCLTEVASWRMARPASAAILAATGRKSGLVDRIERLLDARLVFESRRDLRDRRCTVIAGAIVLTVLTWFAPRVQIVASSGENGAVGDTKLTDAAKPQASGERQLRDGELEDEAETETFDAAPAIATESADSDSASLFAALDSALLALESELEQLGPLLREHETEFPQAESLAKRLRGEIVRLKLRRERLKALSRKLID